MTKKTLALSWINNHYIARAIDASSVVATTRFMRATSIVGDALGHSWVGLLVLRAMDPRLQTPVPLAYAYKMMMFFVPASGGKNAIVIGEGDTCLLNSGVIVAMYFITSCRTTSTALRLVRVCAVS